MKKLFTLALFLAFFEFTFAVDINLSNSMRLSENEWIVVLPTITINLTTTQINSFDLVIWASDFLIFNTPWDIKLNNNSVQPTVSSDYKRLIFSWNFSWTVIINWVKIRSYDQEVIGAKLWLNWAWDDTIDTSTTNILQQDKDGRYTADMKPLPISNVSYVTGDGSVSLQRKKSPDLNIIGQMIRINRNWYFFNDIFVSSLDNKYTINNLDFNKYSYSLELYSKDRYYLSDATTIQLPKQQAVVETGVSTGTTTWTDITTGTTIDTGTTIIVSGDITSSPFSAELNTAYQYAYSIGITTMPSIQQANINGSLIRAHMAKMMVNYAKEVLGKTANTNIICVFTDTDDQTSEMKWYIEEACQMGLMGVNTTEFNPNGTVTRAQFGTVLSRVLYGTSNEGGNPYYTNHLQALKDNGIITNTDPDLQEIRGYVMLMLERSSQ